MAAYYNPLHFDELFLEGDLRSNCSTLHVTPMPQWGVF